MIYQDFSFLCSLSMVAIVRKIKEDWAFVCPCVHIDSLFSLTHILIQQMQCKTCAPHLCATLVVYSLLFHTSLNPSMLNEQMSTICANWYAAATEKMSKWESEREKQRARQISEHFRCKNYTEITVPSFWETENRESFSGCDTSGSQFKKELKSELWIKGLLHWTNSISSSNLCYSIYTCCCLLFTIELSGLALSTCLNDDREVAIRKLCSQLQ